MPVGCEYGGDERGNCTTAATCDWLNNSNKWLVTPPSRDECGAPASSCPSSYAAVPIGQNCALGDAVCDYPEGRCGCTPCSDNLFEVMGQIWNCNAWPTGACAPPRPHLGDACSTEGAECFLDECCQLPALGPDLLCQGGYWGLGINGACSCGFPACP
jgi:hypothetical protein